MTVKEISEKSGFSKSAISRCIKESFPEYSIRQGKKIDMPENIGNIVIARLKNKTPDIDIEKETFPPSTFPHGNCRSGEVDIEAIVQHCVETTLKMVMPCIQDYVSKTIDRTIAQINHFKQPEIKALPAPVQKIEVSIVDLPDTLARVASAAVNNKLKSEARKKLLDELQDDLFN